MITITFPAWFGYIASAAMVAYVIQQILKLYIAHLENKLRNKEK